MKNSYIFCKKLIDFLHKDYYIIQYYLKKNQEHDEKFLKI